VRLDALWKIKSAFGRSRPTIDELERYLGFDDGDVLIEFLTAFDQDVSFDGDEVLLGNPQKPEVLKIPRVRTKWIDGLRQGQSVSHIISGYPTPPVVIDHQSKDSFRGAYRRIVDNEATFVTMQDFAQQKIVRPAAPKEQKQATPRPKPPPSKLNVGTKKLVSESKPDPVSTVLVPSGLFGQKSKAANPKSLAGPPVARVTVTTSNCPILSHCGML
jgi:hypothetical protein